MNCSLVFELFLVFALGLTAGAVVFRRRQDEAQIERALDTIGIRRKEFISLKGEVNSLWRASQDHDERFQFIEQSR